MKETKIAIDQLDCYYRKKMVLKILKVELQEMVITTITGYSCVRKNTFLMFFDRPYEAINLQTKR